jgi:hypothetical protein
MTVVFVIDGVIKKVKDQSVIVAGTALYKALNETYRVVLLAEDKARADVWLKVNNISKKLDDIYEISGDVLTTIETIRSMGKIDFVVTENTDLTKQLIEVGIPVLVFLNPSYTRPEFRPDGRTGVRSWQMINEELDKQQGLYDEDSRINEVKEYNEFEDSTL